MEQEIYNNSVMLPDHFCQRMQELLEQEAKEFFESFKEQRTYGLRYNLLKFPCSEEFQRKVAEIENWQLSAIPWCQEGYYYPSNEQPGKHPWHEAGAYYIQEPSAMSAVELLGARPGEKICDLCAAPGGKTTQIAGKMQGQGLLVANEFYQSRAKILSQNVERMGIANTVVLNESCEHLAKGFPEFFDRILVDAPCSGEGMFRKDQKAVQEWSQENVELCAKRQQQILSEAAKMLRPGGVLVYATCTFAPLENENSIASFLMEHPEFSLERVAIADQYFSPGQPQWVSSKELMPENISDHPIAKTYRLWPHKLRGEGHFAARLVKAGEEVFAAPISKKAKQKRKRNDQEDNKINQALQLFQEFQNSALQIDLQAKLPGNYILFSDQLYLLPEAMPQLQGFKTIRPGLHLGTCKKNRFEPSHALALYLHPEQAKQVVELHPQQTGFKQDEAYGRALKYLHGETIECDNEQKGWVLVCVDGLSLGWGKAMNGVVKNHYPKGLRICY